MSKCQSTDFGKILRIIRVKSNIMQRDMAHSLGMSTAYLSAMEVGRRRVPISVAQRILDLYGPYVESIPEFWECYRNSTSFVKIQIDELSDIKKQLVYIILDNIDSMDDDTAQQIIRTIIGDDGDTTL